MRKHIFLLLAVGFIMACNNQKAEDGTTAEANKAADSTTTPPSEFADPKLIEDGRKNLQLFANGDIDGWSEIFADNAVYQWSSGDSIAGKQAIVNYWKDRRKNVIDSLVLTNDIHLPLKVNVPQRGPDQKGIWILSWYQVDVKYRNGKKLLFWTHVDQHFNEAGKVDRLIQYLDRAPINAALSGK